MSACYFLLWHAKPRTYFVIHCAVEYEYEETLQTVKYGEDIRHERCMLIDIKQPKSPGQAKQNDQNAGTFNPRSETQYGTQNIKSDLTH